MFKQRSNKEGCPLDQKLPRKKKMLSLRISERQFEYLDEMAKRIKDKTGFHITRASIVLKLMEYGYPSLEQEFPDEQQAFKTGFKISS